MAYGSPYLDFVVPGRNLFSYLGAFNLFMIIGIPLFVFVLWILRLVFRTRLSKGWRTALGIFWGLNIMGFFLSGVFVAKEFEYEAEITQDQTQLEVTSDTLSVDLYSKEYKTLFGMENEDVMLTENELIFDNVSVSIQRGDGPGFELQQVNKARGVSSQKAHESAENIDFEYRLENNELAFPRYLEVTKDEKFRVQGVNVTLLVPEGKFVKISKPLAHNHGHIQKKDSEHSIWRSDNNVWKMEAEGLVCMDCE